MSDRHAFRASWHEYDGGIYFITICTHNKEHLFGRIASDKMLLSELGKIALDKIESIPSHFPSVEVYNQVVMPNHIHMVLSLEPVGARYIAPASTPNHSPASTPNLGCLKPPMHGPPVPDFHHNSILARIVGTYKAAVTRDYRRIMRARCIAPLPQIWQRLYHEHIIRDQQAFEDIMEYVSQNVERWEKDVFNIELE